LGVTGSTPATDAAWVALAEPMRRRAVELLAERPRRAGELAALVGVSAPTMSKHLRVLRHAGLVSDTHPDFDTRVRVYSLQASAFTGLRRWLELAEQGWTDQLEAFGAFVRDQREH
jgi:DNA-binding transcriptional ArsR family regulator